MPSPPVVSPTGTNNYVFYAWVSMRGLSPGTNTDPQVYISHEIVELITDCFVNVPNTSAGWLSTSYCSPGGCELGDKCLTTTGVGNYTPAVGTNTWACSYYSNKGGGCILPGIVSSNNPSTNVFTNPGVTGVLPDAHIVLLFWKTGWSFTNSTNPALGTADEIKAGVQNLISKTKFYTGLSEYGVSSLTYDWAAINSTTTLPATFRESDVQQAIKDSMNAGAIPIAGEQVGGPGSSIYIVIVDSSAQYVTAGVQGSHGAFLYNTPPPNNVPTTNPPVGSTPGIQADAFGITQLYPSKAGGSSWSLPSNPSSDARHVVDSTTFTTNADGSYKVTSPSVVYNIAANNGFTEASLVLNQATLNSQKYMQDAMDWTNVEQTCYYRVNTTASSTHNGPANILHAMRGAIETNSSTTLNGFPKSCEAADYRMMIEIVSGVTTFQKDLQHTAGMTASSQNPKTVPPSTIPGGLLFWQGHWVGIKTVVYTRHDGTSVQLELWIDFNNENKWTKILSYIDQGNWGGGKPACGGTSNMVINWGGPLTKFEWFNITDIDIKWASIREIDPYGQNPTTPSPPSNTPPTVDPTGNPPSNLPPTPPPPNQQPPPPSHTGTKDKFGVRMIYPTKTSGETWYISANGLTGDPRVFITPTHNKETVNGDGSFHLANNDDVMVDVSTSAGYSFQLAGGLNASHAVADARQYLMHIKDWKNVEVTFFHSIDACKTGKTSNRFDCDIRARHGSHSKNKDCQAACYIAHIRCDTSKECKFSKKQWHEHRPDDDDRRPRGVSGGYPYAQVLKRWIGRKLVTYNIVDPKTGKVTGVKLEHYWNDSGDGVTWTKLHETTDWGAWGDAGGLCNGAHDQIISWGGPFVSFVWDDLTTLSYKWLSVREIDTSGQSSPPGGPPSPSPGGGPPPVPPIVNPVIGANIYNVLKVVSSVIIDDSGGCNIGFNPNLHIGETQLGPLIPGTASQINMSGYSGSAQRVGQKVVTASSVLYKQILAEVVFNLRIVGFPTTGGLNPVPAIITCSIRRGFDDTIINTMGSIPANVLSSVYQSVSFKTPGIPNYTLAVGDIISLEFTGGDAFNYVQVQTDTTSGYDGANSYAMEVINGVVTNLTTTDMAGGFWSTGQTGVLATTFYNVPKGTIGVNNVAVMYLNNGGTTAIGEIAVNSSSQLIGRIINEIDIFLVKRGNPTGTLSVYILENIDVPITYSFGTLDVTNVKEIGTFPPTQFNFVNYNNNHVNTVNSNIVIEYKGGDRNNNVGVLLNYGNPYDADNSNAYYGTAGSWTHIDGVSAPPPPPPGNLTTSNVSSSTAQNTPVDIVLTATDADPSATITYTIPTAPTNGTKAFKSTTATTATVTYTPNTGYSGPDSFTYQAHDSNNLTSNTSTVSMTVGSGGGGGFVSVYDEPYANNTRPMNGQQNTMVGEVANSSFSFLVGKKVTRVDVYMYIFQGNPTGTVSCVIQNSAGSTMATIGSISASSLSRTNGAKVTFTNTGNTYAMQGNPSTPGDRVAILYSGGDFLNSIYVNYQNNGTQDGGNTVLIDGGGVWTSYDVCMKIWTGGP